MRTLLIKVTKRFNAISKIIQTVGIEIENRLETFFL